MIEDFYKGKKVLITGHTGFKGSWLCHFLHTLDADIYGYSLDPPTMPSLFEISEVDSFVDSCIGDITDFDKLIDYYTEVSPDITIHMAAQPLVREGYRNPRMTYETNVMGTVNILECARINNTKSVLNVTTDKVYDNLNNDIVYQETDRLDGYDPYSNSKSCSELVTHSYKRSFQNEMGSISTARAGNVIGGGDFASERIIPDCVRAAISNDTIKIRNPNSIRPYQHVLEPLYAYLTIASKQFHDGSFAGSYNIGPNPKDCISTKELATLFCDSWGGLDWIATDENGPHEANYLKLDNSLLKQRFGITPKWNTAEAVYKVVDWTKAWASGENPSMVMDEQIKEYMNG